VLWQKKILGVAIVQNISANSFFKQNDEQLVQKGKFDLPIELSIAAIPTIFANFSPTSQNSAQQKMKDVEKLTHGKGEEKDS